MSRHVPPTSRAFLEDGEAPFARCQQADGHAQAAETGADDGDFQFFRCGRDVAGGLRRCVHGAAHCAAFRRARQPKVRSGGRRQPSATVPRTEAATVSDCCRRYRRHPCRRRHCLTDSVWRVRSSAGCGCAAPRTPPTLAARCRGSLGSLAKFRPNPCCLCGRRRARAPGRWRNFRPMPSRPCLRSGAASPVHRGAPTIRSTAASATIDSDWPWCRSPFPRRELQAATALRAPPPDCSDRNEGCRVHRIRYLRLVRHGNGCIPCDTVEPGSRTGPTGRPVDSQVLSRICYGSASEPEQSGAR